MQTEALRGGFANQPVEAAFAFRAAMTAMARPGTVQDISGAEPPAPLSVAAGTLILTLCDPETGLALCGACDTQAVRDWVAFHTGASIVTPDRADFAVGDWAALQPITGFRIGTPEYPDRSATLIVEMDALRNEGAILSGPGIRDTARLALPDAAAMARNGMLYPLGLDFYLTSGAQVAAVPRSTRIEEG
ncbi:MAG: phosphonate C-P lyase system protein PhnH [Paracoccaceae bacterium]